MVNGTNLIIVDTQVDFCEGGSLGCAGGWKTAARIEDYVREMGKHFGKVYASRDFHAPDTDNGGHFAAEPDFVDTWPAHCVQGTEGAEYAFNTEGVTDHIVKGMNAPAYSVLEGIDSTTEQLFEVDDTAAYFVCGIATDYCVKATVMGLLKAGAFVVVLSHLCTPVTQATGEFALDEMIAAGAVVV